MVNHHYDLRVTKIERAQSIELNLTRKERHV